MKKIVAIIFLLATVALANQKVVPPYNPAYWDDILFPASIHKQGANNKPAYDETNLGLTYPANDETAVAYINAQMSHKWAGTALSPHCHIAQATSAYPIFAIDYRWYPIGSQATGNYTTITTNAHAITYTSGTIHQLLEFPDITPPANPGLSSMLDIKLYRKTGDGAAANVLLKEFDIHYEIDQPGSRQEYTK